jgi:hypothetical protein
MGMDDASCSIRVSVRLTGAIKAGPALIDMQGQGNNRVIKDGTFPIGMSLGQLYIYHAFETGAQLLMPKVINHPECSLVVVVRFPLITQTLLFGEFYCQWQDTGETQWRLADQPVFVNKPHAGYRGIRCSIPQRTVRTPAIMPQLTLR